MEQKYTGPDRRVGLSRYLTQTDVWGMAFGFIIGWGAFVMPGTTFLPAAGPGGTVLAMAISTLIMIIIGENYSYLMVRKPRTGGVFTFTKEAFGRDHAFLCSWFLCLAYLSVVSLNATALLVVGRTLFVDVLKSGFHYTVAGYDVYLAEVGLSAAILVLIGLIFITQKPFLQKLQTILAIILLLGTLIVTVMCLPYFKVDMLFQQMGDSRTNIIFVIMTIVLLAPWAFVGFDVVALETVHFNFPVKKTSKLIILSIILGGFVYASMSVISVVAVPDGYTSWQEYIGNLDEFKGVQTVPTFFVAKEIMGTPGLVVMSITALSAILTGVIGAYRATTRTLSTMSEDKIISRNFSSTTFCIMFIMLLSIAVSMMGRNSLVWFVDLITFGAIVGFGYSSASALKFSYEEGNRKIQITGTIGTVITVLFAIVQMVPNITVFETMASQSYLFLACWCLIGYVFYWRTVNRTSLLDFNGISTSSTVLFTLLFYSAFMWFAISLIETPEDKVHQSVISYGIVLVCLVFAGLIVMLYVQGLLRKRHVLLEREKIHAEESNRAKSKFLFSMSHDLRTPMNAIIGFTNLARQEGVSKEEKDVYLDKIEHSGHQLLGIIDDVLDMSRIESGKMELHPDNMNIVTTIGEIEELFAGQMADKNIKFVVDTSDVMDEWILCDKNRLNRILLNLLSNACKFTPEGGSVELTVGQNGREDKIGLYQIRVMDTGIGMSESFVENMFAPFERERSSTVSGIQGTGLGLSIAKAIVDMMQGTIIVNTEPDKGTEFIVDLPIPIVSGPKDEEENTTEELPDFTETRVLLVEDNYINREIASAILAQYGFLIETAENGRIAVNMIEQSRSDYYDLILMDIQMPVMDGYTATRTIRELENKSHASVPVIAMTANAFKENEDEAKEAGMDAYITKPLDVQKMMRTIANVLADDSKD